MHSNELYHHGVKGQRWGVIRFRYEDGIRTPTSKKSSFEEQDDESPKVSVRRKPSDRLASRFNSLLLEKTYEHLLAETRANTTKTKKSYFAARKLISDVSHKSVKNITSQFDGPTKRAIDEFNYLVSRSMRDE